MKAVVVYESLWGNTAAIARAIAEGIGPDARAMSTAEASCEVVADVDLIVAGAPLIAFRLPTEQMRETIARDPGPGAPAPNMTHPSMRAWLAGLPAGHGRAAAFETRIWWSPGSAAGAIDRAFRQAGYRPATKAHKFVVKGKYGPLRDGEIEKARAWGAELARTAG